MFFTPKTLFPPGKPLRDCWLRGLGLGGICSSIMTFLWTPPTQAWTRRKRQQPAWLLQRKNREKFVDEEKTFATIFGGKQKILLTSEVETSSIMKRQFSLFRSGISLIMNMELMNWSWIKSRPKRTNVKHDSKTSTCHDGIKSLEPFRNQNIWYFGSSICVQWYIYIHIYSLKSFSGLSVPKNKPS